MSWDLSLFHAINDLAGQNSLADAVFSFLAQQAAYIYGFLLLLIWFGAPRSDERLRRATVVAVVAGVLALLVNYAIGNLWYRPRPFVAFPGQVHQLIPHAADSSFPSDHAAGSFAFTAGIWGGNRVWGIIFLVIASTVSFARVYVGVHYPSDVLAGAVIGLCSGWVVRRVETYLEPILNLGLKLFHYGRYSR